jgi:uncharacterized membrane protein YfcA
LKLSLYPYIHVGQVNHPVPVVPLVLVGLCIGYVAGMFGVGGGFLLTPMLNIVFRIPIEIAVGSALCQKIGTSIASFLKYRHLKRGEPRFDWVMMGGSIIGVDAGTRLLRYLAHQHPLAIGRHPAVGVVIVESIYAVMLSITAWYTFADAIAASRRAVPRGDLTIPGPLAKARLGPYIDMPAVGLARVSVPVLSAVGFILGVLSGLLGIGGGVAFMPVLLYGYGLSVRNAAGTGILLLLVTVVTGTVAQAAAGFVSLPLAMTILIGSSVGSQLGALTTHHLPNRVLRVFFGCLVAGAVGMIVWDLVRNLIG